MRMSLPDKRLSLRVGVAPACLRSWFAPHAAIFAFFFRNRFLPIFDMLSDVLVSSEIACGADSFATVGLFFSGGCSGYGYNTTSGALFWQEGYEGDATEAAFFWLIAFFFFLVWIVLWVALGQVCCVVCWARPHEARSRI